MQLGCLVVIACRAGEFERCGVVVGEHVGEVFDPLGGLGLDPGGSSKMP